MGVPKVCLYLMLLNAKYVDVNLNVRASKTRLQGIQCFFSMHFHLLLTLFKAKSKDTFREEGNNVQRKENTCVINSRIFQILIQSETIYHILF